MAVYYSFHYTRDAFRVQQVINMGVVEGTKLLNAQEWESVKRGGRAAIEKWIAEKMAYKNAVVVLVGTETSSRPWVRYEITKAWNDKKPLVGVRIHGLATAAGSDPIGKNPFAEINLQGGGTLADFVPLYNPAGSTSQAVYGSISSNMVNWVNSAYKRA